MSRARRMFTVGAKTLAAVTAFGVPFGLLWWALAPRAEVTVVQDQRVLPYPVSETLFAGDGYFAIMAMVAGLATGYAAYIAQYRIADRAALDTRIPVLIGLVAGALLGSLVAWQIGRSLDINGFRQAVAAAGPGDAIESYLQLRARAVLLLWPFAAVLQFGLFDAVSIFRGDLPHLSTPDGAEASAEESVSAASTRQAEREYTRSAEEPDQEPTRRLDP